MSSPAIQINGLHKRYGATVAVQHLTLEIPKGSVFGLLGPNGAGKSTTFGILCGWLRATSGSATVLGVAPTQLSTLRGRVAVLPQDAHFPPQIPVRDQLAHFGRLMGLGAAAARDEALRALGLVGLAQTASMRGFELSHGMLKRVGLAQTLVGRPDVVFLDEPTAGLDPKSARQVKDLIAGLSPEATVVLSSHNLVDVQEICTHGAILDKGRLALGGTIDRLTRRGAEINIELKPGAAVPIDQLRAAFGESSVEIEDGVDLRIQFDPQRDVSEVIGEAVRLLLDHGTPMLAVQRGMSLETAFLEATGDEAPSPSD